MIFTTLGIKPILEMIFRPEFMILCVFITPSELKDLGHYLTGELKKVSSSRACRNFRLQKWQNPLIGIKYVSQLRKMTAKFANLKDDLQKLERYEKMMKGLEMKKS